jgi:macrolide transport system ATP-binding/permease protein
MHTIRDLNREQGVTVIVVTHEADIAAYADRVITMRDGQIVSDERRERREAAPSAVPSRAPMPPASYAVGAAPRLSWTFVGMIVSAAAQALGRNKLRSSLTMLGIFIGVAALIAMVAVGQGANEAVKQQIASLGTNLIVVIPGARTAGGVRGGFGSASTLTVTDAEAIRREGTAVVDVAYQLRQSGQVQYANQNWNTVIQGVTPSYIPITNWRIETGRTLTEDDQKGFAMVCLLGQTVVQNLFGPTESPVGAMILIKGIPVRVVGLLASKGQTGFGQDQDDVVILPYSSAESKVIGVAAPSTAAQAAATTTTTTTTTSQPLATSQTQNTPEAQYPAPPNPFNVQTRLTGYVNGIFVQAASQDQVKTAIDQVTQTLNRRHRIRPGDIPDFAVRNLSQIAQAAEGSSQVMAILLATVASISLLVGGIGIMNILLVSVTERTREIGIRMAIGARRIHILFQFLVEAVLLSVTGGLAGIAIGVAASKIISAAAQWPTLVSPAAIVGGFVFSAAVGIFFGYYPARKAARLDPIEALRYE